MDAQTRNVIAGMVFCQAGCIGAYLIAGPTVYLLAGVAFIIAACSLVVGTANKRIEKREELREELYG